MTEWRTIRYLCTSDAGPVEAHKWAYELTLPEPLASWDTYAYWERARTLDMAARLKPGDVLVDVGAEHGWQSCVYASMVGPENMVLVEPGPCLWPNIRRTWERNCVVPPLASAQCLLTDEPGELPVGSVVVDGFPVCSGGPLTDGMAYGHVSHGGLPRTSLDALVLDLGVVPDAITIDVEGAELLVLRGAEALLRDTQPTVWVSIHPDLMERDFGSSAAALHEYMAGLGYIGEHLGTDHEEHWRFEVVDSEEDDRFWRDEADPEVDIFDPSVSADECLSVILPELTRYVDLDSARIVEVGCGIGRLTGPVAERFPGATVVGTDISARLLAIAEERASGPVYVLTADLDECDDAQAADAAYSVAVLQHIDNQRKRAMIAQIARALRLGGVAVIQFVEGTHASRCMYDATIDEMRAWCSDSGLRVRTVRRDLLFPRWVWITATREAL